MNIFCYSKNSCPSKCKMKGTSKDSNRGPLRSRSCITRINQVVVVVPIGPSCGDRPGLPLHFDPCWEGVWDRDVINDGTVSCETSAPSPPTSKASIPLRNCSVQKEQQRYLLDMSMRRWQYRPGTGARACRPRTLRETGVPSFEFVGFGGGFAYLLLLKKFLRPNCGQILSQIVATLSQIAATLSRHCPPGGRPSGPPGGRDTVADACDSVGTLSQLPRQCLRPCRRNPRQCRRNLRQCCSNLQQCRGNR